MTIPQTEPLIGITTTNGDRESGCTIYLSDPAAFDIATPRKWIEHLTTVLTQPGFRFENGHLAMRKRLVVNG